MEIYELDKKEQGKYKKIRSALINDLKSKGLYKEPFIDLVDRYMAMWKTSIKLEHDIETRGVQVYNEKSGWKKNDSVALHVNTNKQMLILLDKLSISASKVDVKDGADL